MVNLSWKRIWPLALACAAFLFAFAMQLAAVLKATHGEQLFVLDDPYIHASIAKNLLIYHTFGISPNAFASASSSILWPFLLAALFSVFGLHLWIILAFNVVLSLVALFLCHGVWRCLAPAAPGIFEAASLLAIVIAGSLVSLTFVGLEHILQFITVLSVLSAAVVVARIPERGKIPRGLLFWLYLSGLAAVATRFEGAFAVCLVCCFLFLQKRRSLAVLLGIVSALPILFFGWYSIRHGADFFPNSVLLKHGRGRLDGVRNLFGDYSRQYGLLGIFLLTCAELALCRRFLKQAIRTPGVQLALMVVLLTLVHCQFAAVGVACRYDAYLVELCLLSCALLAAELLAEHARAAPGTQVVGLVGRLAVPAWLLLVTICIAARIHSTQSVIRKGVEDIYEQQLQTARFLAEYYPHGTVAVNDIGAVSYLRSAPTFDLFGLGSNEVARLKIKGSWDTASIAAEVQKSGAGVAVVYDKWFTGKQHLPSSWVQVAKWKLPDTPPESVIWGMRVPSNEVVLGDITVSFYATQPAEVGRLVADLRSFSPCVPPQVSQLVQGETLHGAGVCALDLPALDKPVLKADSARNFSIRK